MQSETPQEVDTTRAGWRIPAFMSALGLSVPTFYTLDPRPQVVKVGRSAIIVESPRDYLARAAALGGVKTVAYSKRRKAA